MTRRVLFLVAALLIAAPAAIASAAGGWETYKSDEYGIAMLMPSGASVKEKEYPNGWASLVGESDGVRVYAFAKLGPPEKAADIENFGVKFTEIPSDAWTVTDSSAGSGWKWSKTVRATKGTKLVYGGYGVGPKGSYLLIIVTTPDDFAAHKADYEKWMNSVQLH